jgi:hypothetical protein
LALLHWRISLFFDSEVTLPSYRRKPVSSEKTKLSSPQEDVLVFVLDTGFRRYDEVELRQSCLTAPLSSGETPAIRPDVHDRDIGSRNIGWL